VFLANLRDPEAPARAVAVAVGHFGRLDLLVNNAGATKRADFFTLTEEDWQDGFALKFHGYVRMTPSGVAAFADG
jgi:NAD(P)-dependent dehydrogenase (short-subunit alcohol dehydrogenase family)